MKHFSVQCLALLASTATAAISYPALAQQASGTAGVASGETGGAIIVTARKREESLQDVPLSITAISGDAIIKQGVDDIRDIVSLTPGLSISEFGSGTLVSPIIRGISQLTGGQFAENNVSTFYNGIYIQNQNLIDTTFLDIERVEVVKGPVSALYGRNAYAGVINYVTKRPSDTFEGSIRVIGDEHGRRAAIGSISGPIIGDTVKARIGARLDSSDGSFEDPVTGIDFEGYRKFAVQGALEVALSESVNLLTTVFYANDTLDQPIRVAALGNCGAATGAFQPAICGKLPDYDDSTVARSANPAFDLFGADRELLLATAELNVTLGAVDIKSITSFGDNLYAQNRDQDGSGVGYSFRLSNGGTANLSTYTFGVSEDKSFTQELRASVQATDRIRATIGGFYNNYEADTQFSLYVDASPLPTGVNPIILFPIGASRNGPPPANIQFVRLEDEEYSAFGILDIEASEQLTFSAEARYSRQRKFQNQSGGFLTIPATDPDGANGLNGNFNLWSFRFTGEYDISPSAMIYASAAKGNKAGGFNSGLVNPADVVYDPEVNWTYELGFKTDLLGGRALFDATLFYSDLSGIQLFGFAETGTGSIITNGGDADAYGFEVALSGEIASGFNAAVGLAYANPRFKDGSLLNSSASVGQCRNIPACANRVVTVNGRTALDLGGLSLPRQSDWQATAQFDIEQPLTDRFDWTFRGNYKYQSKQFTTTPPTNVGWVGDRHTINLRAGLASEHWTVELFVDNLLDDGTPLNFGSGLNAANVTFPLTVVYGRRRAVGLETSLRF